MTNGYSKNCEIEPIEPQVLSKETETIIGTTILQVVEMSVDHIAEHLAQAYQLNHGVHMDREPLKAIGKAKCIGILEEILMQLKSEKEEAA